MKESIEQSAREVLTEGREIQMAITALDKLSSALEPPRGKYAKAILAGAMKKEKDRGAEYGLGADKSEEEALFRSIMEELDEVARKVSEAGEQLAEMEADYYL